MNKKQEVVYVVARNRPGSYFTNVWRIWSQDTDFYVQPRSPRANYLKLSLHGGREFEGLPIQFHVKELSKQSSHRFLVQGAESLPAVSKPEQLAPGIWRAARLRFDAGLFSQRVPMRELPERGKSASLAQMISIVEPGHHIDIDFIFQDSGFDGTDEVNFDGARISSLSNANGQKLHLFGRNVREAYIPTPRASPVPIHAGDAVTGFEFCIDPDQLIWLVELPISSSLARLPEGQLPGWLEAADLP